MGGVNWGRHCIARAMELVGDLYFSKYESDREDFEKSRGEIVVARGTGVSRSLMPDADGPLVDFGRVREALWLCADVGFRALWAQFGYLKEPDSHPSFGSLLPNAQDMYSPRSLVSHCYHTAMEYIRISYINRTYASSSTPASFGSFEPAPCLPPFSHHINLGASK